MVDIVYTEEFPNEIRDIFDPLLKQHTYLVPGWCKELLLVWRPDAKHGLSVTVEHEYRFATIFVHALWLDQTPQERLRMIAHEILHITLEPLLEVHRWTIDELDDGVYKNRVKTQWRASYEAVISDLTYTIVPS